MPRWSVITAVFDPAREHLEACIESVRAQSDSDLQHVLVDDASTQPHVAEVLARAAAEDDRIVVVRRETNGGIVAASQDALAAATAGFVALLDHDDVLEPDALATMAEALVDADVAYSDHDLLLADGRTGAPYYKPDFSPEQLRNQNYILHFVTARRSAIDAAGGFRSGFDGAQDHDLLLRLAESSDRIAHVPRILYHWRQSPASVASDTGNKPWAFEAGRRAVAEHCERVGIDAEVEAGVAPGTYRIRRRLASTPRVSVIIPTRGGSRPVWGVDRCFVFEAVESLVTTSTYPDLEIVVVYDNVTPEPVLDALRRVTGDRLVLVRYDQPFNFSEKINMGVAASTGEVLLFLNDDTELIEPDSVETLVAHLDDPTVGMVGPKLLFADGTVQDGGHVYNQHLLPGLVGWHGDSLGPWQLRPLAVEREVSGVTAAVAAVRRDVFDEVGGFDESMPVSFNDVDFSLKIRASGRRIIWTPHAAWYHFESQTRAPTATPAEFEAIEVKWGHEIANDPYYNPNLSTHRSDWLERPLHSGEPMVEPEATSLQWLFGFGIGTQRSRLDRIRIVVLAAAFIAMLWAAASIGLEFHSLPARFLFTWVPTAVIMLVASMAAVRGRWVLSAGVLCAVAPSLLTDIAATRRQGFAAMVAIIIGVVAGPLWRRSRAITSYAVGMVGLLGLGAWWAATPERFDATPAFTTIVGQAGSYLDAAIGSLAPFAAPSPVTGVLAWWLALGVVAAAVVLSGRPMVLAIPAGAIAVVVGISIVVERAKGPVDAADGYWIVAGAIVFAASRVELADRVERRMSAAIVVLLAWSWAMAVAGLIRVAAIDNEQPAAWSRWRSWGTLNFERTASLLLPVVALAALALGFVAWSIVGASRDRRGVNVVGYHTITAGLGERTRELTASLREAGVPVAAFDLDVASARDGEVLPTPDHRFDTTVVAAPAFEVELARRQHPELFEGRRLIAGYWFWELDSIPESHRSGLAAVDEVWAPTEFVRGAYAGATDRPVRHVPLPIAEPDVAELDRAALGWGADDFVVLVSFSHLSVMERKNPLGAIEAFRRAFPPSSPNAANARLVIKTINAELKRDDARRLRSAAADDDRIEIRDGRVDHGELMAMIAHADVLLSLHRSEGLGLHIADAMWLGTPVVATDYGGSTDLVDPTCAEIVPASLVSVTNGDGAYPSDMVWADPDLDVAAAAIRRLADDPASGPTLAEAARKRIEAQGDRLAAGQRLAKLSRCR